VKVELKFNHVISIKFLFICFRKVQSLFIDTHLLAQIINKEELFKRCLKKHINPRKPSTLEKKKHHYLQPYNTSRKKDLNNLKKITMI